MEPLEKRYDYICYTCKIQRELDEKQEFCPDCKDKMEYVGEYLVTVRGLGKTYFRRCEGCKMRFGTRSDEELDCIQCGKPTVEYGFMWACGGTSFWQRVLRSIMP